MAEDPDLPSLPKVSWDAATQTFTNTRKRNRTGVFAPPPLYPNSSDPAVFSSDDDPHVDNYVDGRHRKKRYVGTWYQQTPASPDSVFSEAVEPQPKPNRTLQRQQDSGVWMGSDGSVDVNEEFAMDMDMEYAPEPKLPQLRNPGPPRRPPSIRPRSKDGTVREILEDAVEDGDPEVDLSSIGLIDIPNGPLTILHELVIVPSVNRGVPFEPEVPKLGIYLSGNKLVRAPSDIFNLEHLTYLSLRNNRIRELPPSIGQLSKLRELNISLNSIRYLPGELLNLLKYPSPVRSLHIHPNPFYRPEGGLPPHSGVHKETYPVVRVGGALITSDDRSAHEIRRDMENNVVEHDAVTWRATLVARSPVQYSDSRGLVLSRFRLPFEQPLNPDSARSRKKQPDTIPTEDVSQLPVLDFPGRLYGIASQSSRVLSLFELASKSASRAAQTWDLASRIPPGAPPSVARTIERIEYQSITNGNSGTLPCSICGRYITTPVAQWIEWWAISRSEWLIVGDAQYEPLSKDENENAIPFLKRGCSQSCVPNPMAVGQVAPGFLIAER
ncbi:hypothetical protein GGR50DRAFT_609784 [Xylaria sp. CBS 124048]|nr:hypothetical protein GGR50DRAFT_609784 [Xylaria sp. CBS 124048]